MIAAFESFVSTLIGNQIPLYVSTGCSSRITRVRSRWALISRQQCVSECPVEAIFQDDDVPEQWRHFIQLNGEMAKQCPEIVEKKAPLVDDDY